MKQKFLLFMILVMAVPMTMMADDPVEIDGIYYNLITKAKFANVTSNPNKYTGDIVIPSTVTYGGEIYNVKEIEEKAFYQCYWLTSITIPDGVTSIETLAFYSCTGLTSIDIPNSVTNIDGNVFSRCSGLAAIIVESGNTVYDSRDNCNAIIETSSNSLITGCKNTIIPDDVTKIGISAFSGCGLTSIDIPDGVTILDNNSFMDCSSLTSITIPSSVTQIGYSAFEGCIRLTSIVIPNGVTQIGNRAFKDCTGLKAITIPSSVRSIGGVSEYYYAFVGCSPTYLEYHCNCVISGLNYSNLETLIIGDEVTNSNTIGNINNNINLKNVTIGSGITDIGDNFKNCDKLDVVTCHATTPPTATSTAFDGSYIGYATLIVPDEAYEAYSTTEPWSKFGTILRASQVSTVTAKDYTREYGDANPAEWEYTVVGQSLDGVPNRTCAADETSAPGEYPIVISQGTETNTNVTYVNGTLTITKAPLTITANSYTIKEGDALPSYDAVFTGLKNNEQESVVSPVFSCSATDSNTPGTYDINVTATSDNYTIATVAGTLTILPDKMSITIGAPGVGTYCSPYDLDFSTVTDFKAYIATGYNSATGNVIVQAVKDVPAGTGLFLKGTPGTYDVPCGESSSYYVNMLVGVTEATTISATDGNMTNFLLSATNTSDACFRPISSTYNLKANRAYLQIPTSMVSSSAGANSVGIEFEEGVTGIDNSLSDMDTDAHWFTLDGRKLNGKPTQKGIYVVNGQKVVIK